MAVTLNDVHSQLNPTCVHEVRRLASLEDLRQAVRDARASGLCISMAGGRHAMGGQQFAIGALHLDMTGLARVLDEDAERGILHLEGGAMWPAIISAAQRLRHPSGTTWAIRQKQTGVDDVTLAGSISVNAHGRGLHMSPLGDDVEALTVVTADADVVTCSREQDAELFSLVIGGYGLFGIIYSAKLCLTKRHRLRRIVNIIDIDDAANAAYRRIDEGCTFGDFQYAIDSTSDAFLRRGVLACYRPVADSQRVEQQPADLPKESWLKLLKLAHENKSAAFNLYAQHYLGTEGQEYWSDTMQLSTYIPTYAEFLAEHAQPTSRVPINGVPTKETLVIGEYDVPPDKTIDFVGEARRILRRMGAEVIYGTIRLIREDDVSFLRWANRDYCCIIFNLRTTHTKEGIQRTAETFRSLSEASVGLGGSFFLTYHHYASAQLVEKAYPEIGRFFKLKRQYDPQELFQSEWYRHYRPHFLESAA